MAPWRQVPSEELSQLRNFLERRLPHSILVKGYVEVMLRYDIGFMNPRIYRAMDPNLESVIVVVAPNSMDLFQTISVFFDEGKVSDDKLASLLTSIPELDWNKVVLGQECSYITEKLRALVTEGKLGRDLELRVESEGLLYILKGNIPADISLPEGMRLGVLSGSHTDFVRENWKYGHTESREAMKIMLENLPSAAVFVNDPNFADDSNKGQPVAWIQTYPSGSIGNTFTLPEYRRRGLGSAVTLALARKVAASGRPVHLAIKHSNEDSKRMHEKIGFEVELPVSWDLFLPPGVTLEEI